MLESAIAENLRTERTLPARKPKNFNPPFPAYTARFPKHAKDLVMAIIGTQYRSVDKNDGQALKKISSYTSLASIPSDLRPGFQELAAVTDNRGYYNVAVLAYWVSKQAYHDWAELSGFNQWWQGLEPERQEHGWFLEVFFPTMDRFETVFSNNEVPEGAAHMREGISGPIEEHVYWGSMRDRLPLSQTDELVGDHYSADTRATTGTSADTASRRVVVQGKRNLAIIRSGQDWSETSPEERKLYLETMHPTLTKGMNFLRDNGAEVGCYDCRFMGIVDPTNGEVGENRTFGLAYFNDLKSLEGWSKQHPTHLDIFGGFLKYAKTLDNNVTLRLFHEVLVLEPGQQLFEYICCHDGTGMLTAS
ncbi:putative Phenylacetaldoxime dehydratase [Seiridium cardinale]